LFRATKSLRTFIQHTEEPSSLGLSDIQIEFNTACS
jgi:hypothetical protein